MSCVCVILKVELLKAELLKAELLQASPPAIASVSSLTSQRFPLYQAQSPT
jgi:hypothetical protein